MYEILSFDRVRTALVLSAVLLASISAAAQESAEDHADETGTASEDGAGTPEPSDEAGLLEETERGEGSAEATQTGGDAMDDPASEDGQGADTAPEPDPFAIPAFVREDAIIPEALAEREEAEEMVRDDQGVDWPVIPFGRTWIGTAVSERDGANLWLRQRFGIADPEHTDERVVARTERTTTRVWGIADVGLEIGLGGDRPALPSVDIRASGWVDQSVPGSGASTAGTMQELHWGTIRARRNARILRGIRFTLSPAQIGYKLEWDEREGLMVFARLEASSLGYVHTSSQGRARTFNGIELAYFAISGGPEFEFHPEVRMRVELGGFAEWAAGAQSSGIDVAGRDTGPTGTFRNDYSVFGDLTFEFTDYVDLSSRIQLDFATDSYRNENNDAWRFVIAIAGRY